MIAERKSRRNQISTKPSKKIWRDFEILIAQIQSEITPGAVVTHNHHVVGKSGRRRQLDVTISCKVGLFPVLIVLECKHYKRPVSIEKVEAFAAKLHDVSASEGIMISNSGFDKGAVSTAREHAIALLSYRDAQDVDWNLITGSESWIKFYLYKHENVDVKAILDDESEMPLVTDLSLLDEKNVDFTKAGYIISSILTEAHKLKPIGMFEVEGQVDPPLFINTNSGSKKISKVAIKGTNSVSEYVINLKLGSGHVLTNTISNTIEYQQVMSEPWDWQEILHSKPSRDLTIEEYNELSKSKNWLPLPEIDFIKKRYWRVVLTKRVE